MDSKDYVPKDYASDYSDNIEHTDGNYVNITIEELPYERKTEEEFTDSESTMAESENKNINKTRKKKPKKINEIKKIKSRKGGKSRKRIQYGSAIINDKSIQNSQNVSGNRFFITETLGHKIVYVIPSNTLVFKDVASLRVPAFNIVINNNYVSCNLKRRKKFINYLALINNEWYAIMRIFRAINSGVLSAWTNTIFYKFSPGSLIFNRTNYNISFNPKCYTQTKEKALGIFRSDKNMILVFKEECLTVVERGTIFNVLQRFRNEQILSQEGKNFGVEAGFDIFRMAFDN